MNYVWEATVIVHDDQLIDDIFAVMVHYQVTLVKKQL